MHPVTEAAFHDELEKIAGSLALRGPRAVPLPVGGTVAPLATRSVTGAVAASPERRAEFDRNVTGFKDRALKKNQGLGAAQDKLRSQASSATEPAMQNAFDAGADKLTAPRNQSANLFDKSQQAAEGVRGVAKAFGDPVKAPPVHTPYSGPAPRPYSNQTGLYLK